MNLLPARLPNSLPKCSCEFLMIDELLRTLVLRLSLKLGSRSLELDRGCNSPIPLMTLEFWCGCLALGFYSFRNITQRRT